MENEIWKDVLGYEGVYHVSDFGRIKSLGNNKSRKEKILSFGTNSVGYYVVCLSKMSKTKTFQVHQLVAIAFLNHTPCGYDLVVNHIDFNKLNNRADNLSIVTQRENANKKHIKSSSEYTGVCWCKTSNKWMSNITINGKLKSLGAFKTELEASNAYQNKLKELKINN